MRHQFVRGKILVAAVSFLFVLPVLAEETPSTTGPTSENDAAVSGTVPNAALVAPPLSTPEATALPIPEPSSGTIDSDKWQIRLYPILAWAPIFRANVDFSLPSGGGTRSGSTNLSFNGAALFGLHVIKSK